MFGQATRITVYAASLEDAEKELRKLKGKPSKLDHVLFGKTWEWKCISDTSPNKLFKTPIKGATYRFVFEKE